MMGRLLRLVLMLSSLCAAAAAHADALFLVHGYLAGPASWFTSGVVPILERHGWRPAAVLRAAPGAPTVLPTPGAGGTHRIYLADLPSQAPLQIQAAALDAMLAYVAGRHPRQPIYLVGHSAGGVVARLALIWRPLPQIKALVTIAAPNLGTARALQALDATDVPFPLSMVSDFVGGEEYRAVADSRPLLEQLTPPRPGSLLYWLNHQPYPPIHYISVVRGAPATLGGDGIVPGFSQDLNNVPALRGEAVDYLVPSRHELGPLDGRVIAHILAGLQRQAEQE